MTAILFVLVVLALVFLAPVMIVGAIPLAIIYLGFKMFPKQVDGLREDIGRTREQRERRKAERRAKVRNAGVHRPGAAGYTQNPR